MTIIVKKKQEIQLFVDEGWYSEEDLVELGWNKLFPQFLSTTYLSFPNDCPFLPASIPIPDYQCSGPGLMAQRNVAQLWVKLTAGG